MRHKSAKKTLGRKSDPRRALLRSLVSSLIVHGHMRTTLVKAKVCRSEAERVITRAKKLTLTSKRYIESNYSTACLRAAEVLAKKYEKRNGGYTRLIRSKARQGDNATEVLIEFV